METTILARLRDQAHLTPEKLLLDAPEGVFSYSRFYYQAASLADQIRRSGVVRGASVGILARDHGSSFAALFGCWMAGNVAVPINLSLSNEQQEHLLAQADVKLLLMQGGEGMVGMGIPTLRYIEMAARRAPQDLSPISADATAMILFTSGSTGVSKGVRLTLAGISGNALETAKALGFSQDEKIFVNTPPYYTSTLSHFLTLLSVQGSVVARNGFYFGKNMVDLMEKSGCSAFGGAPTHLIRLVETVSAEEFPSQIRFWMSSGDHLPIDTIDEAAEKFPHLGICTAYGLTEVGGRLCLLPPNHKKDKRGSVGKPLPGMKVCVKTSEGTIANPGEMGEIHVRGSMLMQGYLGLSSTEEFPTGDFGYLDGEGYLWLKGRKDDIFKSGAEKVSTIQVHEAILKTGMCLDAAVLAVADVFLGKVPHAYVVPNGRYNEASFLKQLRAVLPPPMVPKRIHAVHSIPRTGSGKVQRTGLRDVAAIEL